MKNFIPPNNGSNNTGGTIPPPNKPNIPNIPNSNNNNSPNNQGPSIYDLIDDLGLINYNEKFKTAGPLKYRDGVIAQTISTLITKNKPNPLLIGQAGTGKTKIVEELARLIEVKDPILPKNLYGYTIYELPISNIVSGASLVGQLEERLKELISYFSDKKNKAILFLDEIHLLTSSNSDSYAKIAQILKPALARGSMKLIGATTSQESISLITDPAFNRRFSRIIVDELSKEQTFEILKVIISDFISHYNNKISISEDNLKYLVENIEDLYPTTIHRPDNAISLLDRVFAETAINKLKLLKETKSTNPTLYQALLNQKVQYITETDIKRIGNKILTGNSEELLFDREKIEDELSYIKGQDKVLEKILNVLEKRSLKLFPQKKPTTFLFAGASGVGKTEVTKIISKTLTGHKPIILNMTEYSSPADITKIIGSSAGYVGFGSNAEKPFDSIETNPYQIILLDEFEKADKSVQRLFMQVMDEGMLKLATGKELDFTKAVIIATTNAHHTKDASKQKVVGFNSKPANSKDDTKELFKYFDKELIARFETKVTFSNLSKNIYEEILKETYKKEKERILIKHPRINLSPEIDDDSLEEMLKRYIPDLGARPAKSEIEDYIYSQV